ncbi:uncharacterized protein NECHADRAFT_74053 [Fusarium vanettenii 77-13-4]|uniref:F-box domain-containing protein n=1 Tax=Fusarium vanettenii (strain ATCC MYA-4622 / CBS 123669 / FGSC 9596 / NRRL 45880 / 77-13-4) TaxID=660122 RepID=C7YVR8_FUSV7|nr:uncharacterized protein NECHADRAFT_74053 [Fusarium vanettenii 77-13-4]EEU44044.1 predicted protein [Fusarium vanettenii 77-13-4]
MPPRKRIKRDADPPMEAPAEVLVEEQKPFPLLMLPQLVLHLVFSCLQPSEMSGISRSSTLLRSLLLPCFTVSPRRSGRKPLGDGVMGKLPGRILESLWRTIRVRTIDLDFAALQYVFQSRFIKLLETSPRWPDITNLNITGYGNVMAGIFNYWLLEGIKKDRETTWFSTLECRAMSNRAGQLVKLYLGHYQFVIQTRNSLPNLLAPWIGKKAFETLEWFVVSDRTLWHIPSYNRGYFNSMSDSVQMAEGTQSLIETLARMPRLRRLTFWVERGGLGPCLVRQDWTPNDNPLTSCEMDDWYTNLVHKIARSLPKLEQLGIMDNRDVVYKGTRTSEGHDMTVCQEMLEAGSRRFPQGIDD